MESMWTHPRWPWKKAMLSFGNPNPKSGKSNQMMMTATSSVSASRMEMVAEITGVSGKDATLRLLRQRSEEGEINGNGETGVGNGSWYGSTSVGRSNRKFRPPERLNSIADFELILTYDCTSKKTPKEPLRPRQLTIEEIDSDFHPMDDKWRLEGGECLTVKSVDFVTWA